MTPQEATTAFIGAMSNCPDEPSKRQWTAARAAYHELRRLLTPDQRRLLWTRVADAKRMLKSGVPGADTNPYLAFARFGLIRARAHQRTEEYRTKKAAYDTRRRQFVQRREQIQNAKKRYREKQRAQRIAAR